MAGITLKERAKRAKRDAIALYYVLSDKRTPWYAKAVAAFTVGYALSPIDIIPDFIPILGYLDDLLIVPAGIALALRLTPPAVLSDARARAEREGSAPAQGLGRAAAFFVAAFWLALIIFLVTVVVR
ncbi:MAG TPA: hypothetical protein DCG47_04335 [Spirochaetaceae bacterium]|jgi:uncharacterized membrane protein YkvA (DUF1232 family)|nr:hypothetical protein [Spirochaetaceae bacterium]